MSLRAHVPSALLAPSLLSPYNGFANRMRLCTLPQTIHSAHAWRQWLSYLGDSMSIKVLHTRRQQNTLTSKQLIMTSKPFPVNVHPFPSPTPSSCAYELGDPTSHNALICIGGLTSGPHTSSLPSSLLSSLQAAPSLSYSIWEFRMRSSYTGFGYSSLANDVEDISALVTYVRRVGKGKVVLCGSSTGLLFLLHSFIRFRKREMLIIK